MRCSALLLQSITRHFFSKALLGISPPRRCFAILLFSDAMLCHSSLFRCVAQRIQRVAVHFFSGVGLRVSSPRRRTALLLQSTAVHFFSKALLCISNPTRCGCKHCRSYAAYCISFALLYLAVPIRGISLLCTAPLCPRQAKQRQCLVLLFYSAAVPGYAVQFHACASRRLSAWTIACADISP